MASRLELQSKLEELLESRCVYYNSPESSKMGYPAIRFSKKSIDVKHASNAVYSRMDCYQVIVIATIPDHPVNEKILALPYCSFDRHYTSNNLDHDVYTLFY